MFKENRYAPATRVQSKSVKYYQWQKTDRTENVEISSDVNEAFQKSKRQQRPFLVHKYIKRSRQYILKK